MKIFNLILFINFFVLFTAVIPATNLNGRFVVMGQENSKLKVLLQVNTNTGSDDMGGATMVIGFDRYSLGFSNNPQVNTDFIFHNFNDSSYRPPTVTKPSVDKLWLNIDLPFNHANSGFVVSGVNGWTDVVTLLFDIINPNDTLNICWLASNPYWGIYDANNTTLWNPGEFQNLDYLFNNDVTPPEIVSACLIESSKLEVLFSESIEVSSALNLENYVINKGINVLSGYLSNNQNKITLNTTPHVPGENYTLSVSNVKDLAGNIMIANDTSEYIFVADVTPPEIQRIVVTSNQFLTIQFSERIDPVSATTKNNYSIGNGINILSAQILPDSTGIKLKTSRQTADLEYTLTVSNIKDRSGNYQNPNPTNRSYRTPRKIKGNRTINRIVEAASRSWEQNYTPNKTIDGFGMSSPESRWQSGRIMPDTITYAFDEDIFMDSLRISFYKGNEGRIYKYSIYTSPDSSEWNPVVEDIWSEESEWTELEFDSTGSGYLKLVLHECSIGNRASIWEIETFGAPDDLSNTEKSNSPATFELSQNYPNPFNPSTKIAVNLPQEINIRLAVYNILGELVEVLADGVFSTGKHEFSFDAKEFASGLYIYRIETADFVETKKMILLR